ncbi:hypothetical protein C8F01DRAFT_1303893 [Mycena amicta]|nr:hypothetical protein C8F01DRAFT_1303893 [Mycena amicta]
MMSAGTQIIFIDEVYTQVLRYLDPSVFPWEGSMAALTSLARTCKAASDPALDTLWHKIYSAHCILHLLPPDAWTIPDDNKVSIPGKYENHIIRHPEPTRALTEADLVAFDRYAPRVKEVRISRSSKDNVCTGSSTIFTALHRLRDPIFPNMRELIWDPSVNYNTMGAFQLISPAYGVPSHRFSLSIEKNLQNELKSRTRSKFIPPVDEEGFAALTETSNFKPMSDWISPRIKHLELRIAERYTGKLFLTRENVLSGLQGLPQLEHLSVDFSVDVPIILHLATLSPNLRSLRLLGGEHAGTFAALHRDRGAHIFPMLEKLDIGSVRYDDACTLLSLIRSPALHTVWLHFTSYHAFDPKDSFLHILTAGNVSVSAAQRRRTLRRVSFTLREGPFEWPEPSVSYPTGELLEPLYACVNLRSLYVNAPLLMCDSDVERMSTSWKDLESLSLTNPLAYGAERGSYIRKLVVDKSDIRPRIESLAYLAERCLGLNRLELSVDARMASRETIDTLPVGAQSAADNIGLSNSLIEDEDVEKVAEFLHNTFPKRKWGLGAGQPWQDVRDRLEMMAAEGKGTEK